MKKTTRNYIWLLTANFLLLLVVGVIWQARLESPALATEAPVEGMIISKEPVPLPEATFLKDLKTNAALSQYRGQWVLVNLWASWCGPCIVEMPSLRTFADNYKAKGLTVIGISMDVDKASADKAVKQHGFGDFARNWDHNSDMQNIFNPPALPASFLLDPAGDLRAVLIGEYNWSDPILRRTIDKMLLKASTSIPAQS